MVRRRAQVSIEYLVITAFAFLLTIPLVTLFYTQSHQMNEQVTSAQVGRIASEIVDAANEVYYLGQPSKKTITVFMPQSVQEIDISGDTLDFKVSSSSGEYEVVKIADTNLTGSIKTSQGLHNIEVEAQLDSVKITG